MLRDVIKDLVEPLGPVETDSDSRKTCKSVTAGSFLYLFPIYISHCLSLAGFSTVSAMSERAHCDWLKTTHSQRYESDDTRQTTHKQRYKSYQWWSSALVQLCFHFLLKCMLSKLFTLECRKLLSWEVTGDDMVVTSMLLHRECG